MDLAGSAARGLLERPADVPDVVPEVTAVPSPKARVLVPHLFVCALAAVAFGMAGTPGEFAVPVLMALGMTAAPLAHRFGVTVLDAFAEPPTPLPASRHDESHRAPEPVRRAV